VRIKVKWSIFGGRKSDQKKAKKFVEHLEGGGAWQAIGGRRLQHNRECVSIPVGRRYRITLDLQAGTGQVQTHEQYNGTKPG